MFSNSKLIGEEIIEIKPIKRNIRNKIFPRNFFFQNAPVSSTNAKKIKNVIELPRIDKNGNARKNANKLIFLWIVLGNNFTCRIYIIGLHLTSRKNVFFYFFYPIIISL